MDRQTVSQSVRQTDRQTDRQIQYTDALEMVASIFNIFRLASPLLNLVTYYLYKVKLNMLYYKTIRALHYILRIIC